MTAIKQKSVGLKRRARNILFSSYRVLLFGTLFFIALLLGFSLLSKSYCGLLCEGLSARIQSTVFLTLDIVSFFVLYPFILGYISLCAKISDGASAPLSELFVYYSSAASLFSCFGFLLKKIPEIFLRTVLPFVLLFAAYDFCPMLFEYMDGMGYGLLADALYNCFFIFDIAFIAAAFILSGSLILSTVDFCAGRTQKYTFAEKRSFLLLRLSLIPIYALSVLSFGILFAAYALPMTVILYSLFSQEKKEASDMLTKTRQFDSLSDTCVFDRSTLL